MGAKDFNERLEPRGISDLLREIPGILSQEPLTETFSFSLLDATGPGGLPKGALIGISGTAGSGKTEIVLRFLAENPTLRVAWVEDQFTVYPCAFPQHGVDLNRVLFIQGERSERSSEVQSVWTIHQLLRSQIFKIIIFSLEACLDELMLRRLQLAAGKAQASVILLTESPLRKTTWPISVQLHVRRVSGKNEPVLEILKYRGQRS